MTDERILAEILMEEELGIYDEEGVSGNIFIGETPINLQNEIDLTIRKTGGSRVIRKLTGAKNSYLTIYAKGNNYELVSEKLETIGSILLNKAYNIDKYFIENVFVFSEPQWILTDDNGTYLFDMTLTLTII